MRLALLPALALLLAWPLACAGAENEFLTKGLDHFYNLEYDQAIAAFEQATAAEPQSPEAHNSLAQTLLYREMFRHGAIESDLIAADNSFLRRPKMTMPPEAEKRFVLEIKTAMELAQARVNRDPRDVSALYALGVAYGWRSNYNFLVRKSWRDALSDATAARKLHNRITEIEPSNFDARLIQGIHEYVVGSLPWYMRTLSFLVGFSGDSAQGIRTLEEVAAKGDRNKVDAQIILCALYRRENQTAKALPLAAGLIKRFPRNYLVRIEQAQMYGAVGDKKNALATLDTIAALKKARAPGYAAVPWGKIYYERGDIQFWYKDLEPALENLKKATADPAEIDAKTEVLAYLRQGQIYDLTGRHQLAIEAYNRAVARAPEADAAKESKRYIANPYKRG